MRVRTSHQPDGWRDMGPVSEVQFSRSAVFAGTLVIGSDRPHTPRCPVIIASSGRRCCLRDGHETPKHRSES